MGWIFFVLFSLLIPTTVYALPTPDALIGLVNLAPLAAGTAATVVGGLYLGLRRKIGSHGSVIVLAALCLSPVLASFVIYLIHKDRVQDHIEQLAMYLRCDVAAHELTYRWRLEKKPDEAREQWREYGNFSYVKMGEVGGMLAKQPDASLVDVSPRVIAYYGGFPGVQMKDGIRPFVHVRAGELAEKLKETRGRDLYLFDFKDYTRLPEEYLQDKTVFGRFEHIYLIHEIKKRYRYVYDQHGTIVPAVRTRAIDWPVENEKWIIDEKVVAFPHMATLLPNEETAHLFKKRDVFLLAPYHDARRSEAVQDGLYLRKLLHGVDGHRILSVDMNSPKATARLQEIAGILDGKKFIVIGLSKHDWLYEGLDATYELWQLLGRDKARFKLIGFNTRLPEVVAINWEKNLRQGFLESLRGPIWAWVRTWHEKLSISEGYVILLAAMMLRLLLSPIGIKEAYSRLTRLKIKQLVDTNPNIAWKASAHRLLSLAKVNSFWELLGGLVTLLLILPAYNILAKPPSSELPSLTFMWIKNLAEPDYILSIVAGIVIYWKIRLGNISAKRIWHLLISIVFTLVLLRIPSVLLVYIIGVLSVTLSQDLLALKFSHGAIRRALLESL